jgi:hypothetical protein
MQQQAHLTDLELVMAADGELPDRRATEIRAHLDSCWTCRERMRSLEETIAGFVRARNRELGDQIPPAEGPRALLRARLAEARAGEGTRSRWAGTLVRRATATAACFCALAATLVVLELTVNAEGSRPNSRVTPGETRPIALSEVCKTQQAEVVRNISTETRNQVLATYGIKPWKTAEFEVDYLITPDLGGAESMRNLWPQPYSARWNAKVKDRLEQRLHDLVCAGKVDLSTAQRDIASDWIGAYKKYVGPASVQ